ncbi:geranylgeranylglycerol-phosphate geranylgeranyltransferase [Hanstruepera ponticola]|uniref:geranylgeranylglycerol-phosphate geranylgeranyltransferase n=1 Tax=Hanstruepera ponticola TaxID=2042995 RepID=UPI000CF1C591|nr:geranylgeranylglycerol-phosphate geranylgeranyltransferase [Hanstruepera ponticola]
MNILNLIRWKNLLMIALMQYLLKYVLLLPFGIDITLNGFGFSLLMITTLCLAAAGYIINDIFDQETDLINKPNKVIVGKTVSEKTAYTLFIVFNVIGVLLGFYLSHLVGRSGFFALFVVISALLYIYASYLKQLILVGNIVISILVALSLIIVGLFELLPAVTPHNQETQLTFFKIIFDYAVFAFLLNVIRELIKDIQDIDGDHKAGMNTLPIAIGRNRAAKVTFAIAFIPLFLVIYYVATYMYKQIYVVVYFLIFVIAPLIYLIIKLYMAETKKDFAFLSKLTKAIMLFGMLSLVVYKFVLLD